MLWITARAMILFALAAAALLPPETAQDLRCVAILAVKADKAIAKDAAFYTAIVGADAMDASGQPREAVRDLIVAQVKIVRATTPLKPETDRCIAAMKSRVAIERVTTL